MNTTAIAHSPYISHFGTSSFEENHIRMESTIFVARAATAITFSTMAATNVAFSIFFPLLLVTEEAASYQERPSRFDNRFVQEEEYFTPSQQEKTEPSTHSASSEPQTEVSYPSPAEMERLKQLPDLERLSVDKLDPKNVQHAQILLNFPNEKGDSLNKCFRTISLNVHPDKNLDKKDQAGAAFQKLNAAYETLKNLN